MSDTNRPGDVPPDLPPEFADAYLRGYERARRDASDDLPEAEPAPDVAAPDRTQVSGPLFADEPPAVDPDDRSDGTEPTRTLSTLGGLAFEEPDAPEPTVATPFAPLSEPVIPEEPADEATYGSHQSYDERGRPTWLVPVLLGVAALVLIAAAFFIGKMVASSLAGADTGEDTPDSVVMGDGEGSASDTPTQHAAKGKAYSGPVDAVAVGSASATCESPRGVDAAGRPVRYGPGNVADGDMTTAWRCDGDGVGQRLTLQLPGDTTVGELGIIPGYAKTDPSSGADRYAENDRITKVRWIFDDGTTVVQTLDGSARNRSMQTMRVPATKTGQLVMEILESTPGPRHTVAVSEVRVGSTR